MKKCAIAIIVLILAIAFVGCEAASVNEESSSTIEVTQAEVETWTCTLLYEGELDILKIVYLDSIPEDLFGVVGGEVIFDVQDGISNYESDWLTITPPIEEDKDGRIDIALAHEDAYLMVYMQYTQPDGGVRYYRYFVDIINQKVDFIR